MHTYFDHIKATIKPQSARPAGWNVQDWARVLINKHLTARELQPLLREHHTVADIDAVLKPLTAGHLSTESEEAISAYYR